MKTYVEIEKEEFESFMQKLVFKEFHTDKSREHVYYSEIKLFQENVRAFVLIYSSIHKNTSLGRKVGQDAIRVLIRIHKENNGKGLRYTLWKGARVYRTKNWKKNLRNRIDNAREQIHKRSCPKCGGILLLREGSNGKFYGCENFPKTKCRGSRNV